MQLLSTVLFAGVALASAPLMAGENTPQMALEMLMGRQTRICASIPAPFTCERSCGPGYTECVSFPTCYNPGLGQVCCSNGKYCPKGTYCSDGGCCPDGTTLEQCGATQTLSIIPPPASEPTSSSSSAPPEPTETEEPTSTTAAPTKPPTTTTTSTSSSSTSPPRNGTTTTRPPVPTAGAGQLGGFGVLAAVGGLGALLMAL